MILKRLGERQDSLAALVGARGGVRKCLSTAGPVVDNLRSQ